MPIKKRVTLKDIATELNLSIHTVSKALRGLPGMSENTRHAVREVADRLGYRTKDQERSMMLKQIPLYDNQVRRFIFLITAEQGMRSGIHNALLESVQTKLSEAGHRIEVVFVPDHLHVGDEFENWVQQNNLMFADGIFITPLISQEVEQKLIELNMPRILLNFPPVGANVDSVIWNIYDAMQQSVTHLINLGHERIMYIGDIKRYRGLELRWQAFRVTMEHFGGIINRGDHIFDMKGEHDDWALHWHRQVERLEPTAFICATQDAIFRTYMACSSYNKKVPDDYSLVVLEPEPSLQGFLPDMTRPSLNVKETGSRAVQQMLWRIANPTLPYEHTLIQGGLHLGTTVKAIQSGG